MCLHSEPTSRLKGTQKDKELLLNIVFSQTSFRNCLFTARILKSVSEPDLRFLFTRNHSQKQPPRVVP